MRIWSQYQAVIELMDEILSSARPADRLLQTYFKNRRYMGSSDRRTIKDIVFIILRQQVSLQQNLQHNGITLPLSGRSLVICFLLSQDKHDDVIACFADYPHGPTALNDIEHKFMQNFHYQSFIDQPAPEHLAAAQHIYTAAFFDVLNQPAPCDIRVNTLKTDCPTLLKTLRAVGIASVAETPHSPVGIRMNQGFDLKSLPEYKQGLFEVQDEGSQLISYLCPIDNCKTILDLCAGSGGKSLHLATLGQASIIATDIDPLRLQRCEQRLQRANINTVQCVPYARALQATYDCVLIDAPCTGSGTWRRQPDLQGKLTATLIDDMVYQQQQLLDKAVKSVAAGGYLIYVTCSFLPQENEHQMHAFLQKYTDFNLVHPEKWPVMLQKFADHGYVKLSPLVSQTDAFFGALLQRAV